MKCIIKADDYGFTEAISLGILKAYREGAVRSTGIMINMPYAKKASEMIQECPGLCLGLHVNIVIGRPVADPNVIPDLLQENGHFRSSAESRAKIAQGIDPVPDYEQAYAEVEAQIRRFIHLTGRLPEYLEGHAIRSANLLKAMADLAKKYDLVHYSYLEDGHHRITDKPFRAVPIYDFYEQGIAPQQYFTDNLCQILGHELSLVTLHPGYLDKSIFDLSSFTKVRVLDLEALTHPDTLKWFEEHQIELISHRDITAY